MTGQPPEYWDPRGWKPGANEAFMQRAGVDTETGLLTGFSGSVPGDLGLQYQDIHNQATARARQQMMQQGIGFQEGALGLLQSFRPGGGAYAAADAYSRLAGLHFQRAAMTQPIDYLGDYRRHQAFLSRRRGRRARVLGTVGSLVGMAAGAGLSAIPGVGPLLGGMAGNVLGSAVTGFQGASGAGSAGAALYQGFSALAGGGQGSSTPNARATPNQYAEPIGPPAPESVGSAGQGGSAQAKGPSVQGAPEARVQGPPEAPVQGPPSPMAQVQELLLTMITADLADDPSWDSLSAGFEHQARLREPYAGLA